jgi:hypothetical protein
LDQLLLCKRALAPAGEKANLFLRGNRHNGFPVRGL